MTENKVPTTSMETLDMTQYNVHDLTGGQILELQSKMTPQAFSKILEPAIPVRMMLVGFTEDQRGKDIRDEDVVRPSNHRHTEQGKDETHTWKEKSQSRCPTYGSCNMCYTCGPVGMLCKKCRQPDQGGSYEQIYKILFYQQCVLDSITIAKMVGAGQHIAKADRTYQW